MLLMYCRKEGLRDALEFGETVSPGNVVADRPYVLPGWPRHKRPDSDSFTLRIVDGSIVDVDQDDDGATFVTIREEGGRLQEFEARGDSGEYRIGRRMIVRLAEIPSNGLLMCYAYEIWLL